MKKKKSIAKKAESFLKMMSVIWYALLILGFVAFTIDEYTGHNGFDMVLSVSMFAFLMLWSFCAVMCCVALFIWINKNTK